MKKISNILLAIILPALSALPLTGYTQIEKETDTLNADPKKLAEIIVYANKFAEPAKYVTQHATLIKNRTALNLQANAADVLINNGSVFVQKSQQGGGSPVIRGFEASRILLMVDGVRLNNAIYRAGHLQNIITIDNMVLNRMEVLYGPSSTIYGSDALGGVINMYTKNPALSKTGKPKVNGSVTTRYASATSEARGNATVNIGGRQFASLTSVTYGSFGDMLQGKNRSEKYPDFGKKYFIVKRFGSTDSALVNPNPDKQATSGYKQTDITQKFLYQPKENVEHILNLQLSNSTDVPRYDRLSENNNGIPAYAEWYYGPQQRNLAAYHFSATKQDGFWGDIKITASYQDIKESRISRRFKNNNKDYRWEQVNIFGINTDVKHYSGQHEIHVGAESYSNFVRSTAEKRNIVSGQVSRIRTRYSDGPTSMGYNALYAQHTLKLDDRWTLNDGLRLNLVHIDAVFADSTTTKLPFTRIKQNNIAATGNIGLVYADARDFRAALLLSSGFRAPNVDDMSKVFESAAGTLIVPNPGIKPEYTYNAEMNFNKYATQFNIGGSLFYTWFRDVIVMDAFSFQGKDSVLYNGVYSKVVAPQNKANAHVYGFSVNAAYRFSTHTSMDAVFTFTKGSYSNEGITKPLDHIPPAYGRISMKHVQQKWNAEFFTLFNGWKHIARYNPDGEDNQQYATVDGMPAWFTLNLQSVVNIGKNLLAGLMIENLLDKNYRYFASGISAPGRNFVFSLKKSF
ncbi:TonB-dependent receptor plug domain-containing protein [Terrimonas pollutisoli]|uniref:TonB-dependent receptor plug domain-containing protein n=1 Tax=Terrimonas pollutisoli TaxID=3034147 RepID=UPI0023ED0B8C|nr:TonB-dependent receptor [Terrimonas sp. H1YJ31]